MDVNLKSLFWMCKFCIPHMMEQHKKSDGSSQCSIINNASIQAISSQPHVPGKNSRSGHFIAMCAHSGVLSSAYAAAKGGIVALTRQLACDYGRHGIRFGSFFPPIVLFLYEDPAPSMVLDSLCAVCCVCVCVCAKA